MNPPGRWKILVVDEHSQQLLGSVLKHFDILEENVTRCVPSSLSCPAFFVLTFVSPHYLNSFCDGFQNKYDAASC